MGSCVKGHLGGGAPLAGPPGGGRPGPAGEHACPEGPPDLLLLPAGSGPCCSSLSNLRAVLRATVCVGALNKWALGAATP